MSNANRISARQQKLLSAVITAYTRACAPVGSALVAERSGLRVSPATVRNDLAALEKAGLMTHPHTSAGRIPTAAGYQHYVDHALQEHRLSAYERTQLQPEATDDARLRLKSLAKRLSKLSDGCVMVGFSANDLYYTGIANLFAQPEFRDYHYGYSMSEVIDHLDTVLEEIFDRVAFSDDVEILIGERNPFGTHCSAILTGFRAALKQQGLIGLLGPLRMDYARNRSLLGQAGKIAAHP